MKINRTVFILSLPCADRRSHCYVVFFSGAGRARSHRLKRRLRPGRGIKAMSVTKRAPPRWRSSTILRLWKASSSGR